MIVPYILFWEQKMCTSPIYYNFAPRPPQQKYCFLTGVELCNKIIRCKDENIIIQSRHVNCWRNLVRLYLSLLACPVIAPLFWLSKLCSRPKSYESVYSQGPYKVDKCRKHVSQNTETLNILIDRCMM